MRGYEIQMKDVHTPPHPPTPPPPPPKKKNRASKIIMRLQTRKIIGIQGCALRKMTRSPKVPNYEIQGAQHKAYMKEIRLSGCPKAKVSCLRHPGALRAQPWAGSYYMRTYLGHHCISYEITSKGVSNVN